MLIFKFTLRPLSACPAHKRQGLHSTTKRKYLKWAEQQVYLQLSDDLVQDDSVVLIIS